MYKSRFSRYETCLDKYHDLNVYIEYILYWLSRFSSGMKVYKGTTYKHREKFNLRWYIALLRYILVQLELW